jgi:hypothetical protein
MTMKSPISKLFNFVASYGFACIILFLLLLLTLFGTLDQVENGLYAASKKYFESFIVLQQVGPIPLLLPGVYALMVLLFINMLFGAMIRAPKEWKRPGMLIAHGGIMFMIFAGFVTYEYSQSGHMTLYEGESDDHYQSYYDWEIVITELGNAENRQEWVIPHEDFAGMPQGQNRIFHASGLPFELLLEGWVDNANPRRVPPGMAAGIDGVMLQPLERDPEAERNVAGVFATILPKGVENPAEATNPHSNMADSMQTGLLWGFARAPWVVDIGDKQYGIDLRHVRYPVPFRITLDKFTRELHPRTAMAASFESDVTMTEEGRERAINIRMNEPLRHKGFTFFQASWGPQNAGPNDPLFSTFAVVDNPADQWPKYSCYIIALGLLIHFGQKLFGYLRSENKLRARRNAA